jgi:hypothetical protein
MKKLIVCFLLAAATSRAGDMSDRWQQPNAAAQRQIEEARRIFQIKCQEMVKSGATPTQCEAVWGKPDRINRTIEPGKIIEQWVYKQYSTIPASPWNRSYRQLENTTYLNLENGVLTSIQFK